MLRCLTLKARFHDNHQTREVTRGQRNNPLFATRISVEAGESVQYIKAMHGNTVCPVCSN